MTSTQLERLRSALETRLKELGTLRRQRSIAVERTPDPMDEVVLAGLRELAISSLDNSFAQVHLVKAALCVSATALTVIAFCVREKWE